MSMLLTTDPDLVSIMEEELERQRGQLDLIPSENIVSLSVLEALGSCLTNKYSEGYPGKRYYGGNVFIDRIEELTRERAKKLFGTDHANVQPYSGSPANQAAYLALADPGDTMMGMNLLFGGHLTHGWKVNFSARYYRAVQYTTDAEGFLNYDALEKQVKEVRPKILFCGATAYSRLYDYPRLAKIAHAVDAFFVADIAHEAGLIAAQVIPSPVGFADVVTLTTHKTLRGPRGAIIVCNGKPSTPLKADVPRTRENIPTLIDRAVFPGLQGGPHNHTTAAIAVCLKEAMTSAFRVYAEQILKNAKALAETFMGDGFKLTTGGTDNHLMIIDLRNQGVGGREAETALDAVQITVNKNTIPFDDRKPYDPSGIRVGTPSLTSRGFREPEMRIVGELIVKTIHNIKKNDPRIQEEVKRRVQELASIYPIYPGLTYR